MIGGCARLISAAFRILKAEKQFNYITFWLLYRNIVAVNPDSDRKIHSIYRKGNDDNLECHLVSLGK